MKMIKKDQDHIARDQKTTDSGTINNVGNKVLPITDHTTQSSSSSANHNEHCRPNLDKNEKTKGDGTKTISRLKELLKRAVAAKAEKGGKYIGRKVLLFKNRTAIKAAPDNMNQLNDDESPKISFRWEVETCSTTSSVYSAISALAFSLKQGQVSNPDSIDSSTPLHVRSDRCVTRPGNWITTDSEYLYHPIGWWNWEKKSLMVCGAGVVKINESANQNV
ncbi:hypothetical protein OROMI_016021 [Orobanche minor]